MPHSNTLIACVMCCEVVLNCSNTPHPTPARHHMCGVCRRVSLIGSCTCGDGHAYRILCVIVSSRVHRTQHARSHIHIPFPPTCDMDHSHPLTHPDTSRHVHTYPHISTHCYRYRYRSTHPQIRTQTTHMLLDPATAAQRARASVQRTHRCEHRCEHSSDSETHMYTPRLETACVGRTHQHPSTTTTQCRAKQTDRQTDRQTDTDDTDTDDRERQRERERDANHTSSLAACLSRLPEMIRRLCMIFMI